MDQLTRATELRRLTYHQMHLLANHLNRNWQDLMMIIPRDLDVPSSSPTLESQASKFKYTQEHLRMIEDASNSARPPKLPGHILLDEWGTSGKIRPTLGHLLNLLVEANLYRVADFLATDILKEEPPTRPESGPAAPIDIGSLLQDSLSDLNFDSQSLTFNGSLPQIHSTSSGQLPAMTELFGNDALVTATDENSNAPTLSTNLESDPILEGLSDVEIPLSMLMNAAAAMTTTFEGSEGQIPSQLLSESETVPSAYQSDVPNISLFGGIPVQLSPANESNEQQHSQEVASNSSSSISGTSSSSAAFPVLDSQLSTSLSASNCNQSLPQLSFLMNNVQLSDSTTASSAVATPPTTMETSQREVEKFSFDHLVNCTNNFNGDDFTDLNSPGRKLGAGGFGSVFLAANLTTDLPVAAVKRLNKSFEQVAQKFELEIKILQQHRHENLVRLLGFADDRGELCLIYEYVSGGNLERRLERCRSGAAEATFSIRQRLGVALGVAKGIDYLHSASLVHRDVKSANVLLTADSSPKLCDFGLLRPLNSRTTTMVVGSSGYMAPEVVRGTYDYEKVDIFAFGVLQLELLTGLPVISEERREDFVTYVEKVAGNEGDVSSLLDKRAGDWGDVGPRWYREIVIRAVELSPNRRSHIQECLQKLDQLCNTLNG